jgi:glycosyltransferase involved in cell wall biosynthesis
MEPNSTSARTPPHTITVLENIAAHEAPSTLMPVAILHLLRSAQLEETGPARIVAALAVGLNPNKYHVHAWFLGPSGPLVEDLQAAGANARSINWSPGIWDPIGAYRFWSCLRNYDFAIVHHHFAGRSIRQLIRLSSNARLVVQLHARISEPDSARNIPVAVRGADLIIAVSRAVAFQITNLKPIVVHAGVESRKICAEDTTLRTAIVIGAACRLVDIKGLLDLILAMALLYLEFPSLQLEIAGTGPERENLEREVMRLGLTDRIRFLGWQRDLGPIFRSWDIFAMPSLEDAFPMACLEAMAEGLPVVATSVGGLPEMVEDGETGYLVPPSDVTALSGRLRLLILDPKRRRAMGTAGRERTHNHFSIDRMVAEMAAIYDSLVPDPQDEPKK